MKELSGKVAVSHRRFKGDRCADRQAARRPMEPQSLVNYAFFKGGADEVVAAILGAGGKAIAVQADVAKSADLKRLFEAAKSSVRQARCPCQQCRRFRIRPPRAGDRGELPQAVRHQRPRRDPGHSRSATLTSASDGGSVINLSSIASVNPVPKLRRLLRLQERRRRRDQGARHGTGGAQNSRQRCRAGYDERWRPGVTSGVDESAATAIGAGLPMGRIE